jgi:rfaE bifunctional protein nucleotidyltransferase chain/domain
MAISGDGVMGGKGQRKYNGGFPNSRLAMSPTSLPDAAPSAQSLPPPTFEQKIAQRVDLAARVAALPQPVVMTNGVFDILHRGHVTYLAQARSLGASLVVAVNTDASVKRLGKGQDRPLNTCLDRMAVLAALDAVSLVVEFDEDTALQAVQQAHPDIYVKGGDYQMDQIPEGQAVLAYGGQALAICFEHERSTTALLRKVRGG